MLTPRELEKIGIAATEAAREPKRSAMYQGPAGIEAAALFVTGWLLDTDANAEDYEVRVLWTSNGQPVVLVDYASAIERLGHIT